MSGVSDRNEYKSRAYQRCKKNPVFPVIITWSISEVECRVYEHYLIENLYPTLIIQEA